MFFKFKRFIAISLFFLMNVAYAVPFPQEYYPTKSHPRMWLTKERLAALNSQKDSSNQRWNRFKELCDSLIDNDSSNDPWNLAHSPQSYTAPLALMYVLTKNDAYADKALELMDKISLDLSQYGDPDHEPFYYMALTYDWLYDYVGMTTAKKNDYHQKMRQLSDKFWTGWDLTASGTDSDANLLTGMLHLTFGAALYGDYNDAVLMLDRAWTGWVDGYYTDHGTSNRGMIEAAMGGVYFTGMAYFPSTDITGIMGYEMTLKTACGYDVNIVEPNLKHFWKNTILSIISLTEPTRARIADYGSWQDPNILSNQPWMRRAFTIMSYFADQAGDTRTADIGNGYNSEVNIGDYNDYFIEFFFFRPGSSVISPYSANLEKVHFAKSPDFLMYRDNWNTNALWGVFRGDGSIPMDQQAMDQGHFSIWRGDGYLTKGARNYEALSHGDFFNVLSIENGCTLNGVSCSGTAIFDSEKPAKVTRHWEENNEPLLAYAMLNADGQWNDPDTEYNPIKNVKTYRRHFVWMGNYTVIFDRLRAKQPIWSKYRLRALTEPIIAGDTVFQLSENGKYKLIQRTLEPKNIAIIKVNEKNLWSNLDDWIVNSDERRWQSVVNIPVSDSVNILNVIQTGTSAMEDMDMTEYIKTDKYSGVHIGNLVACFSSSETLNNHIKYTIHNPSNNMYHLIADFKTGFYDIWQNGSKLDSVQVKEGNNTIFFKSNSVSGDLNIEIKKMNVNLSYLYGLLLD